MLSKVIGAAARPHDLGLVSDHDETLPELASMDPDAGSVSSGDSMTDYCGSVTSYE